MELSQKELAEIEGVTAKQICRRETERLTWKAKMKKLLAKEMEKDRS